MESAGDIVEGLGQFLQHAAAHASEHGHRHGHRKLAKMANKLTYPRVQRKLGDFISRGDFEKSLNHVLGPPVSDGRIHPKRLRDTEFQLIGQWCARYGKHDWGRRPRTFVILHMIGCEEALDAFVAQHLSDFSLPYTEENLPHAVSGEAKRRQFLE